MSLLEYKHSNGVATLTLNNPTENRLTVELMGQFSEAIYDIEQRDDTRAVLLDAAGPDYCFGGDFTPWLSLTAATAASARVRSTSLTNRFEDLPVPIVTAVQGNCRGGGFELALRADYIIAADNAKFCHPEANIGIFTLLGGVQRVAERVGRTRALQWAMTTEVISAQHAVEVGLINEVVPLADLAFRSAEVAKQLGSGPTVAHAAHKKLLRAWSAGGIAAADDLMPSLSAQCFMSEDAQGSLKAAIDAYQAGVPRPAYDFKGR